MITPAFRYTIARITVFLACLLLFWLLGMRDNPLLLLLVATTVSMLISLFVLRGMREQFADQLAHRVEERTERKHAAHAQRRRDEVLDDEAMEDLEADAAYEPDEARSRSKRRDR